MAIFLLVSIGAFVDRKGRVTTFRIFSQTHTRIHIVLAGSVLLTFSLFYLAFLPRCEKCWYSVLAIVLNGLAYGAFVPALWPAAAYCPLP